MIKHRKGRYFLPNYFKKIALGLLLLSVLILLLPLFETLSAHKDITRIIAKDGVLIAFLLFAFSDDKIEDELTIQIRLVSFAAAFAGGTVFIIIRPLLDLLLGDSISQIGSGEVLLNMFALYFIVYFVAKRKR